MTGRTPTYLSSSEPAIGRIENEGKGNDLLAITLYVDLERNAKLVLRGRNKWLHTHQSLVQFDHLSPPTKAYISDLEGTATDDGNGRGNQSCDFSAFVHVHLMQLSRLCFCTRAINGQFFKPRGQVIDCCSDLCELFIQTLRCFAVFDQLVILVCKPFVDLFDSQTLHA